MTTKIFISYSHHDTGFAQVLGEALRRADYAVFLPDEGDMASLWYPEERRLCIEQVDVVVCILSRQLYHQDSAWVREELKWAEHQQKPLIPVLIEPVEYPHETLQCWRSISFVETDFREAFRALTEQIYAIASPQALALRKLMRSRIRNLETARIHDPREVRLAAYIRECLMQLTVAPPPDRLDTKLSQLLGISVRFAQSLLKGTFPVAELDDDFLRDLAEAVDGNVDTLRAIVTADSVHNPPDSGRIQRPD